MRNYTATNKEEKESYVEYRERKIKDWNKRVNEIMVEMKDSSLKEEDKKDLLISMTRKILSNDLLLF